MYLLNIVSLYAPKRALLLTVFNPTLRIISTSTQDTGLVEGWC